jgi:hypothetical protein
LPLGREVMASTTSSKAKHRVYYKGGRRRFPLSPGCGESYESVFAHGSSVHQSAPTTH